MEKEKDDYLMIMHGAKRLKIPYTPETTKLSESLTEITGIPAESQILIHKGRKHLVKALAPTQHNIPSNATIMVRTSTPTFSSTTLSPSMKKLRGLDTERESLEKEVNELKVNVEKHTKGFLDKKMTDEALVKDEKQSRVIDEMGMTLLERIDALHDDCDSWKAERKSVVRKVQAVLTTVDGVRDHIKELREDRYGEVHHRRAGGN